MSILVSIPCLSMPSKLLGAIPPSAPSRSSSTCAVLLRPPSHLLWCQSSRTPPRISCSADLALRVRVRASQQSVGELRTCRNCKKGFDSSQNHPRACRFHTAHFGGETKRKYESVYSGGTMDTLGGGDITQYWHCCGSKDPFDPGCEAAPHSTYDD